MYLAKIVEGGRVSFMLRQTYRDGGILRSRDLIPLGPDPGAHILYPGGNAFQVDPAIIEELDRLGVDYDEDALEAIFWPFVRPAIRQRLRPFFERGRHLGSKRLTEEEEARLAGEIHDFDRRRLHYLRYGALDQSRLHGMPAKMCRFLLEMSRDEREQYFWRAEGMLEEREWKQYVYVIFNLQRFFEQSFARVMPQGLPLDEMDRFLLEEICRLNRDPGFWSGMERESALHGYLVRYLVMYFDTDWGPSSFMDDYLRQFMDSRREFRWPERKVALDEAAALFGVAPERLKGMSRRELTRLYRQQAHRLHPDKGGEHDAFVALTEAFRNLLAGKKKG